MCYTYDMLPEKQKERERRVVELARTTKMGLRKIAKQVNREFGDFFGKENELSHNGVKLILERHGVERNK